jgi:integrase
MAKSFIKFTEGWLKSHASQGTPGKTVEFRDAGVHGLSLRIHPNGKRVWNAVGSIKGSGTSTRKALGPIDRVSLDAARAECRRVLESWALGREYETPASAERRKEREATEARRAAARETEESRRLRFENVLDSYADKHLLGMKSGAQIYATLRRAFGQLWSGRRIDTLKRSDVISAVTSIIDRGRIQSARGALAALKAMIKWTHRRPEFGLIDAPACTDRVTFADLCSKSQRPRARERVLTDAELRTVWAAASSPKLTTPTGDLVKMLLLSGLRLREAALMARSEIGADGWLRINGARMKASKDHAVPITRAMAAIIARQPVVGDFVFRRNDGPLRCFGSLKCQIDALTGEIPHWTFHDLRRTMRSHLSALTSNVILAERAIAHVAGGVLGTYDRHKYERELKALFEAWERRLLAIVGEPTPNVVPLWPHRRDVKA